MTKPDIIAIGSYPDWDRAPMEAGYTVHWGGIEAAPDPSAVRIVAFKGHDAFTAEMMDQLPNLGLIANFGVGYDAIDVAAATERGIRVTNTPEVLTDDVADLAVGLVIAAKRQMVGADAWVRSGRWAKDGDYPILSKVSGKTLGIVGLGRIGRAIAKRLAAFDMEIGYYSRAPKETPGWTHYDSPAALAEASEILIVALSGGPATAGIVDAATIKALGPKGLLVNVSRGTTIDEGAMLDALESGALGQAALDVFASEPDLDPRFQALENVLLSPHQASATIETRQEMGELQRANIEAFLAGEALKTPVN